MGDCLEQNMSLMERLRPELYKRLKNVFESEEYSYSNVEETETRDGNKALIVERDNTKYRLNSLYKPLKEAEKWADQYEFHNLSISVVMFGMGNALFVREMLNRLKPDASVYLFEPDLSVFLYVLNNINIVDILEDKRVYLFINNINEREFSDLLQSDMDWVAVPTQIICNHPVYDKVYDEEFVGFLRVVHGANKMAKVNIDTEKHMSITLVDNAIRNLKYIKESNYVSEFIGKIPEELPAVIVAAGPSLDKNIDELKRAEGKAFIFATDTAVKYLLQHDIKFDAIITIDAKKGVWHLRDERCHNVPMFCVLEAKSNLMDMHIGRKIWFRGSVYMYDLYSRFNREFPGYNSGGSVATAAFSLCVSMKFKNIVLIGQDLAYSGGVTHAGGVVRNVQGDKEGRELVESIDGGKVWSRYDWLIYLEWFENSIRDLKDINVIDATEGGALIHGSKVMALSEVIDEYCKEEFSFNDMLDKMPYTFSDEEYSEVKDNIIHLRKEFNDIKQKSKEGIKAAEKVISIINKGEDNPVNEAKNLKKVDKINKFLAKQDAYSILDVYITNSVSKDLQTVNMLSDDEDENMKKTLEISVSIYKALIEAVDSLTPVLEETLEKL
ncbi:MAG: motility associated factor glycosyltransferase family protein [Lachnospiraceae bacterium]|nr:motility associated factor glycosyltransferase family protein [Lachnospiraceae bacterium]